MQLSFESDFYWSPNVAVTIHYRAGQTYPVTRDCAEAAIAAGAAKTPARETARARPAAPAPDAPPAVKE